ncbi:MAG: SprT-like domain-containing protein [Gemmatimonadota bacterium]|jgi:hypothetical protein|nr:SprT-like domain-containing protein [Gemmatimonadota bacterium]
MSVVRWLVDAVRGKGDGLTGEIAKGGARFERVVFTRNRRVMISVTDEGRTLRLHELFSDASPELLREIGMFCSRPGTSRGRQARQKLRDFLTAAGAISPAGSASVASPSASSASPSRPHRTRAARVCAEDVVPLERLRAEFEAVNARYFGSSLPLVSIRISNRMRQRNGHFRCEPPEIAISRLLFTTAVEGEAEQTLRHEMIHLWQWATGAKLGHGADFRRWARKLEVVPRARRIVQRRS